MKSFFKVVTLVFICFNSVTLKAKTFDTYQEKINGITFSIDQRIELFNVIAMLGGHNGMTLSNISYKEECLDYFSAYTTLEAPKLLMETWAKGWGVDSPMFFLLYLDDDFNLMEGLDTSIVEKGGGIDQITKLAKAFKNFAELSDFKNFFNKIQKEFYNEVLTLASYQFKDFKGLEYLENYYGQKCNSYNLILNINGGYGNFGKQIPTSKGIDLYAIVGTSVHAGNIPLYKPDVSTVDLILHEFSHGFVNPNIDKFKQELSRYKHLYEPIKTAMRAQGYWHWHVTINEHIVRAIVTRITEKYYGKLFSDNLFYKTMIGRRFIYADAIINKLKLYENNSDKYETFKDFVPELVTVFDDVSEAYITEKQNKVERVRNTDLKEIPIPHEFKKDSTTYFIVGTHENNIDDQKKMHKFVKKIRNMISKDIVIITDDKALNIDLSNHDIVLFGTQSGNLLLKKYIHLLPVKITSNSIITNKIIKGINLQLVTSWVNPFNPKKTMTIFTAQKTSEINNFDKSRIKTHFHYWVAKKTITLDKGNYEKITRIWMPSIF